RVLRKMLTVGFYLVTKTRDDTLNAPKMNCITPIALFVFNRPRLAARVFEAVRRARPKRVFVIADGPRHAEDEPKCAASRALADQVDWDCEVLTNFSETNMGCGHRVASGLDWVCGQTEEA